MAARNPAYQREVEQAQEAFEAGVISRPTYSALRNYRAEQRGYRNAEDQRAATHEFMFQRYEERAQAEGKTRRDILTAYGQARAANGGRQPRRNQIRDIFQEWGIDVDEWDPY